MIMFVNFKVTIRKFDFITIGISQLTSQVLVPEDMPLVRLSVAELVVLFSSGTSVILAMSPHRCFIAMVPT